MALNAFVNCVWSYKLFQRWFKRLCADHACANVFPRTAVGKLHDLSIIDNTVMHACAKSVGYWGKLYQGCQLSCIEHETHAFHPNLTLSRWYVNISRLTFFFFFFLYIYFFYIYFFIFYFCLSEICDARRVPLLCACKIEAKILWSEKKVSESPPPAHQLFWDLRDFIGWERTAVACLTLNPHPMLAALSILNSEHQMLGGLHLEIDFKNINK